MAKPEITQRDLRNRSEENMDAVESGWSFTVTRDCYQIGELISLRRRRRFVARAVFVPMSRNAAAVDLDAFHVDQDVVVDREAADPYDR